MVKRITEKWTEALLNMNVGEVVEFPLEKAESIVGSIIPRLRKRMWKSKSNWSREGDYDMVNGTFRIKREA
nr:MAG TPA: hypothetical protein [Caudoviricetes sp.]